MRKSEQGAIPILLILLAAILVVAGGAAFYVYKKNQNHKSNMAQTANTAQSKTEETAKKAETTSDDNLATGESKELGISFKYPKEWGEAATTSDDINGQTAGKRYSVTFSKKPTMSIYATTKDYEIGGIGGACLYTSPTTVEDGNILEYATTEFINTPDLQAGAIGSAGGAECNFVFLGQKKLVKNPNINYVKVVYRDDGKKIVTESDEQEFANDSSKYYSAQQKNEFIQLAESIQEL